MTPDPRTVGAERLRSAIISALYGRGGYVPDIRLAAASIANEVVDRLEGWTLIGPEQQAALADGEALRALREALPDCYRLMLTYPLATREHPGWPWSASVRAHPDYLGYIANGHGPTIAAAADAARATIEGREP